MSNQQRINVSVKLFEALDRKDKLRRELETLDHNIAMFRAFLEGYDLSSLAAAAAAQTSSPTLVSGSVGGESLEDEPVPQ